MNRSEKYKATIAPVAIIVIISSLILTCGMHFGKAQTSTPVSGIVTKDTDWIKANSPYNLTGNVLISNGATVTVEEGTTVNLNGYYIMVNGSLIVQQGAIINMPNAANIQVNGVLSIEGTSSDAVYINDGFISFTAECTSWNDQTGTGCIIENANFSLASIAITNTVKIANTNGAYMAIHDGSSVITNNSHCGFAIYSGSPVISNNHIDAAITVIDGSPLISNNTITQRVYPYGIMLEGIEPVTISDNVISGAFYEGCINGGGEATIEGNLIVNADPKGAGMELGGPTNQLYLYH